MMTQILIRVFDENIKPLLEKCERDCPGYIKTTADNFWKPLRKHLDGFFDSHSLTEEEWKKVLAHINPEMVKPNVMPTGTAPSSGSKRSNSKGRKRKDGSLVPVYPLCESIKEAAKLSPYIYQEWVKNQKDFKDGDPIYVNFVWLPAGPRKGRNGATISPDAVENYYNTVRTVLEDMIDYHNIFPGTIPRFVLSPEHDESLAACRTSFNRKYEGTQVAADFKKINGPGKPDRYKFTGFGSATNAKEIEVPASVAKDPAAFEQFIRDAVLNDTVTYKGLGPAAEPLFD